MAGIVEAVPLTTLFSLPPECSTRWIMPRPDTVYSNIAYVPGEIGSPQITVSSSYYVDCYPYRISNSFSPGVCPSGDSFIVRSQLTAEKIWRGACCPRFVCPLWKLILALDIQTKLSSGMSFDLRGYLCEMKINSPFTAIVAYTTNKTTLWDWEKVSRNGNPTSSYKNTTVVLTGTKIVVPIEVEWQRNDLTLFPPAYASSVATQVGIEFTATPTISPGLSSSFPPPTGKLSNVTGRYAMSEEMKTGIGVGSTMGGLACGATILTSIWWIRGRKKRVPHPNDPELAAHSRGLRIFLKGKWRAEAEGLSQPVETDGRSVIIIPGPPVELEART